MQEMISANVEKRTVRENLEAMVRAVGGLGKERSAVIYLTFFEQSQKYDVCNM